MIIMFKGDKVLVQMVLIGIFKGLVFSSAKINCQDLEISLRLWPICNDSLRLGDKFTILPYPCLLSTNALCVFSGSWRSNIFLQRIGGVEWRLHLSKAGWRDISSLLVRLSPCLPDTLKSASSDIPLNGLLVNENLFCYPNLQPTKCFNWPNIFNICLKFEILGFHSHKYFC